MQILLAILTGLLLVAASCAANKLNYPRQMKELEYLERVAGAGIGDLDELPASEVAIRVTNSLRQEMSKLKSGGSNVDNVDVAQERKTELVRNLLEIGSNTVEESCTTPSIADDLDYLLKFHQHGMHTDDAAAVTPGGRAVFLYLRNSYRAYLRMCREPWQKHFAAVIKGKLDEWLRDNMSFLIDDLIHARLGPRKWFKGPKRPYSHEQISELSRNPPLAGFVLYMRRFDDLYTDENLKNSDYLWPDFKQAAGCGLMPLCRQVCQHLEEPARLFSYYQHSSNLIAGKQALGPGELFKGPKANYLEEWLASTSVCCRLVNDFESLSSAGGPGKLDTRDNLVERLYRGLVSESEPWPELAKGSAELARKQHE